MIADTGHAAATSRPPRSHGALSGWWIALAVLVCAVAAFFVLLKLGGRGDAELVSRVAPLSKVAWIGDDAPRIHAKALVDATSLKSVAVWLQGRDTDDASVAPAALKAAGVDGLLVALDLRRPNTTARDRLQHLAHVPGLRGDYLTERWSLYQADPLQALSPAHREAMATVARGILGGQRAPRVTSFPEPLRTVRNVEVMVLIARDGRPTLWRSARGSSIARALLTAAQMARRRWTEREQALGGSIDRLLPTLEVEVSLLHEDGTLGSREEAFVDRVFTKQHGVAYERRGSWHYLLPDATQRDGEGSATRAYAKLFEDNGLPPKSLARDDLRLYRLLVTPLATSAPTDTPQNNPGRVASPDDVLGPAAPIPGK